MVRNAESSDEENPADYFAAARQQMVNYQLRSRGIRDERVLAAMATVPREEFVPENERYNSYADGALPIGEGQTISQPVVVAFMAEAMKILPGDKVLEIGTGSGYGAAILSQLAGEVHTVERIAALADRASQTLKRLGYLNVEVHLSDGTLGLASEAPFDAISVTAAAREVPQSLLDQLAEGGRLVIPVGSLHGQQMQRITRRGDRYETEDFGAYAFVPLIGKHGWPE
jgi:protein-L-isoaspartate(D-aspartate) O-methyltransferase